MAPDASTLDAPAMCPDTTSALIGRCARGGGEPCTSSGGAGNHFEAVAEAGVSPLVIGIQGATMMPMAVRVEGIVADGGANPSDHPQVAGLLIDSSGFGVASYLNAVPFTAVAGSEGTVEMLDIFLIFSGDPEPIVDQPATVTVRVTDRDGQIRCGSLDVTAGSL